MIKQITLLSLILFFICGCKQATTFHEIKINDRYTIDIADYLKPCSDLHKAASLQYQNTEKDIYALVIDEKKARMEKYNMNYTIDNYFNNIASQPFLEAIKDGKISIPTKQEINGNKSLIAEITGKMEQTEIYYKLGIVETPFTFYQILVWTRNDNKEKFESDMLHTIESLKEIPQPNEELPIKTSGDSVKTSTQS